MIESARVGAVAEWSALALVAEFRRTPCRFPNGMRRGAYALCVVPPARQSFTSSAYLQRCSRPPHNLCVPAAAAGSTCTLLRQRFQISRKRGYFSPSGFARATSLMDTAVPNTQDTIHKVVILGSGPAGNTAALYTARAQLKPLVLHGEAPGGQLVTTTLVENYPGFPEGVDGPELVERMQKQAEHFGAVYQYGLVQSVRPGKPIEIVLADGKVIKTVSLIIATGARARRLDLPSETLYWAKGVTSCATCDGFFYKGKEVCVVGGGDSAMEEAIFLTRFCTKVYLLHRRDTFRASKIMLDRARANPKIQIMTNVTVDEVLGDTTKVTGVKLRNVVTNEKTDLPLAGLFLAIGHLPNSEAFKGVLELDENGYIQTKGKSTYTNVDGIFACGDVVDHVYRQAITAAGTGCQAAIDAERWLETHNL